MHGRFPISYCRVLNPTRDLSDVSVGGSTNVSLTTAISVLDEDFRHFNLGLVYNFSNSCSLIRNIVTQIKINCSYFTRTKYCLLFGFNYIYNIGVKNHANLSITVIFYSVVVSLFFPLPVILEAICSLCYTIYNWSNHQTICHSFQLD